MAKRLFVGGLPYTVNDDQLREMFAKIGAVEYARVIVDKFTGRSKGFGFVEMATEEEAQKAVKELDGTEIEGRKVAVNEARPQEQRQDNRGGR